MAASSSIWHTSQPPRQSRVDDGSIPEVKLSEAELSHLFKAAQQSGDRATQLSSLKELAELKVDERLWVKAAYCLNRALKLVEEPTEQASLYARLAELELFSCGRSWMPPTGESIQHHRQELQQVREKARTLFEDGTSPEEIQRCLTEGYQRILSALVEESIDLIGRPPPEGFAMIALGSMARREIFPYSDLDFAFLVREPSDVAYFERLVDLLHLKIINMGEAFEQKGFRMDTRLLSKEDSYRLIGTPKQLAEMQTEENSGELITLNAMASVSCITGNCDIVKSYQNQVASILDQRAGLFGWLLGGPKRRERRAEQLIRDYLAEPRLDRRKVEQRIFDVKEELYRPPQVIISALGLYYGIQTTNTLELIDLLQAQRLFSTEGANHLKTAFCSILRLRIQTHLFCKTESDTLSHDEMEGALKIDSTIRAEITRIYQTLIPFHHQAKAFLEEGSTAFIRSTFYDSSIGAYDKSLRESLEYEAALQSAESSAALHPSSLSYSHLAQIQLEMGNPNRSFKDATRAYGRLKKNPKKQNKLTLANAAHDLGNAHLSQGEYQLAIERYQEALGIYQKRQDRRGIAASYNNLGIAQFNLNDYKEANSSFDNALKIVDPENITAVLTNLGSSFFSLGRHSIAMDYLDKALVLLHERHGDRPHPEKVRRLSVLGNGYSKWEKHKEAVECYQEALNMLREIHRHRPHPEIATCLGNLGTAYSRLNEPSKGVAYLEEALEIYRKIYGHQQFHPHIAEALNNLGYSYCEMGHYQVSVDQLRRAYFMFKELYPVKPMECTKAALIALSHAYEGLGEGEGAILCQAEARTIHYQLYSETVSYFVRIASSSSSTTS